MKSKKMFQVLAMAVALIFLGAAGVMAQGTQSTPVSDGGITPYIIDGQNPGGNRTCAEVATAFDTSFDYSKGQFNYSPGFETNFLPEFEVTVTDDTFVSWKPIVGEWKGVGNGYWIPCNVAFIVKGSDDANVYYYPGIREDGDSGLASPVAGGSGGAANLSNLTVCYNLCKYEEPPQGGEWCSPGYWRQPQHLDSWAATGYSPDDLFYDIFKYYPPLSKLAVESGATYNPTLLQVLQAPQYYGAEAFNAVGDLLSAAHPDVNFLGERVEDSCPLD